jgi:hypothetical protein
MTAKFAGIGKENQRMELLNSKKAWLQRERGLQYRKDSFFRCERLSFREECRHHIYSVNKKMYHFGSWTRFRTVTDHRGYFFSSRILIEMRDDASASGDLPIFWIVALELACRIWAPSRLEQVWRRHPFRFWKIIVLQCFGMAV